MSNNFTVFSCLCLYYEIFNLFEAFNNIIRFVFVEFLTAAVAEKYCGAGYFRLVRTDNIIFSVADHENPAPIRNSGSPDCFFDDCRLVGVRIILICADYAVKIFVNAADLDYIC